MVVVVMTSIVICFTWSILLKMARLRAVIYPSLKRDCLHGCEYTMPNLDIEVAFPHFRISAFKC